MSHPDAASASDEDRTDSEARPPALPSLLAVVADLLAALLPRPGAAPRDGQPELLASLRVDPVADAYGVAIAEESTVQDLSVLLT